MHEVEIKEIQLTLDSLAGVRSVMFGYVKILQQKKYTTGFMFFVKEE
jgi:hypothetical protein